MSNFKSLFQPNWLQLRHKQLDKHKRNQISTARHRKQENVEEGFFVMGIGKSHTPEAFVKACENFTYTEILSPQTAEISKTEVKPITEKQETKKLQPETPKLRGPIVVGKIDLTNLVTKKPINIDIVDKAFEMVYNDLTGLALATQLATALKKVDPTFDIRNYGHNSFKKFLEALKPKFEIVMNKDGLTISVKRGKVA